MFVHKKELLFPVQVESPNGAYAAAVLEQFGGANGELKACMQYLVQSFGTADPAIRDLMLDIATEEISHLEMVGTCVTQLMGGPDLDPSKLGGQEVNMASEGMTLSGAEEYINQYLPFNSNLQKSIILGGHGPLLADSTGTPFSGKYINSVGDLMANLQSDVAAELRARKVYEELHRHINDRGARELFDFLIQREEAHALLFMEAVERARDTMGELQSSFGDKQYSRMYPGLSVGSIGAETFKLSEDMRIIDGQQSSNANGQVKQSKCHLPVGTGELPSISC